MRRRLVCVALAMFASAGCARASCERSALAVQVLGSGGPIADDARASSAYLIWHEGRARVLIDAGGGAFARFGQAGAHFDTLDFVGLTHLHVDHTADLPALLKSGFFGDRRRALTIAGPKAGGSFPGLVEWLDLLVGPHGAFRYLDWVRDPSRGRWSIDARELDHTSRTPVAIDVDGQSQIDVSAIGVTHGPVPALAYRIVVDGRVMVFSGDQNGDDLEFREFARDADVLVMHHAIGEQPDQVAERLHARPSEIAEIAQAAGAEILVLSHHMRRSLDEIDSTRKLLEAGFGGRVEVAEDLDCYPL